MKSNYIPSRFKIYEIGFTLVELLVVMAILGVLVTIALVSFRNSQARGRDAQRKSDLKQISSALELFYSDYGKYPDDSGGAILACPYNTSTTCAWGTGEFGDGKTIYFKVMPKDPVSGQNYYYRIADAPNGQKFQLFAYLENTQDPDLIIPPTGYLCGGGTKYCNFAITSSNTKPSE
ncbi:MAG: General secretion pathway protein G [Candidatus Woesebacteria bacterium GW2011_GWA2_40_7]|uniref:General secretion pathway protein G n=3 Tax=Candidatus Woeseibacteriota TaxID=1752722 RepID=A0A0G0UV62_9BACT|nr:MAG: General secretion pathway protein G [Candidatus Woesebacteria bacterium GW2011_GWB1_39_10]KKR73013.1 MAG: General secretion pathway protein G [Candidatus Woesebacteria bacterium GW2011_GWA2_40_7]KKR92578.1 MAG: General secretion pathway protein G [Candidatus Woesebacteria bacterium GW2011_GWA1_41_13b]